MKSLILSPFSIKGQNILRKYGEVIYEPWTETKRLYDPRILGDRLTKEDIEMSFEVAGLGVLNFDFSEIPRII